MAGTLAKPTTFFGNTYTQSCQKHLSKSLRLSLFSQEKSFAFKMPYFSLFSTGCFYDITSGGGGQIFSENYPHKYLINSTCEWRISSKQRGARILLMFDIFSMEGKPDCEWDLFSLLLYRHLSYCGLCLSPPSSACLFSVSVWVSVCLCLSLSILNLVAQLD